MVQCGQEPVDRGGHAHRGGGAVGGHGSHRGTPPFCAVIAEKLWPSPSPAGWRRRGGGPGWVRLPQKIISFCDIGPGWLWTLAAGKPCRRCVREHLPCAALPAAGTVRPCVARGPPPALA